MSNFFSPYLRHREYDVFPPFLLEESRGTGWCMNNIDGDNMIFLTSSHLPQIKTLSQHERCLLVLVKLGDEEL